MKIRIRKSDIIAIIFIGIVVWLIISMANKRDDEKQELYKNSEQTFGIVSDFTYSKSRKFVRYSYFVNKEKYEWSYQTRKGDPEFNIGDSLIILYSLQDISNSTPYRNKDGNVVKYENISEEEFNNFIKKLSN